MFSNNGSVIDLRANIQLRMAVEQAKKTNYPELLSHPNVNANEKEDPCFVETVPPG